MGRSSHGKAAEHECIAPGEAIRTAVEANDAASLRRLLAEARIARQNLDRSE